MKKDFLAINSPLFSHKSVHALAKSKTVRERELSMANNPTNIGVDFHSVQVQWPAIKAVSNYFDIFLNDYPISAEVKWCIAQLQLPALVLYAQDASILEKSQGPFRCLLKGVLAIEKYMEGYAKLGQNNIGQNPIITYVKDIIAEAKNVPSIERWTSLAADLTGFIQKTDLSYVASVDNKDNAFYGKDASNHNYAYKSLPDEVSTGSALTNLPVTEISAVSSQAQIKSHRDLEVFAYTKKLLASEENSRKSKRLDNLIAEKSTVAVSAVEKQLIKENKQLQSYIAEAQLMKVGVKVIYGAAHKATKLRMIKKVEEKITFAEEKTHLVIEKTMEEVAKDLKKGMMRIVRMPFFI